MSDALHGDGKALKSSEEAYEGKRNAIEDNGEASKNVTERC